MELWSYVDVEIRTTLDFNGEALTEASFLRTDKLRSPENERCEIGSRRRPTLTPRHYPLLQNSGGIMHQPRLGFGRRQWHGLHCWCDLPKDNREFLDSAWRRGRNEESYASSDPKIPIIEENPRWNHIPKPVLIHWGKNSCVNERISRSSNIFHRFWGHPIKFPIKLTRKFDGNVYPFVNF